MKTDWEAVAAAINSEREYQESFIKHNPLRHDPKVDKKHTVGNFCTMMQHYMYEIDENRTNHTAVLQNLRKVAACAVRCMEEYALHSVRAGQPTRFPKPSRDRIYDEIAATLGSARVLPMAKHLKALKAAQRNLVREWTLHGGHDAALDAMLHMACTAAHFMRDCGAPLRIMPQPAVSATP